jgi:hypothetical protein
VAIREDTAARRARAVEMRRARAPFAEIGRELGVSEQRAWRIYQDALMAIPAASVTAHRAEESALADEAIRDLLLIARDHRKSPRTSVEAWNSIRGWSEHLARILGFNAAVKVEVSEDVRIQILALAAELGTVEPGRAVGAAGDAEARGISAPPA